MANPEGCKTCLSPCDRIRLSGSIVDMEPKPSNSYEAQHPEYDMVSMVCTKCLNFVNVAIAPDTMVIGAKCECGYTIVWIREDKTQCLHGI